MGEAVYLHRPMLAVPVQGQFEQALNARYLQREGYGLEAAVLDDAHMGAFLEQLPNFRRALASYDQAENDDLLSALKVSLAGAAVSGAGDD